MFYGTSSSMDKDVEAALRPYADAYAIEERRIPLIDPAAVAAALSGGNINAHLVAIVRGGCTMPALSDRQVVDAVAYHMPVPIVSAVGHDVGQPLIQEVVHWAFATPTAFGTWLADRAKGATHAREAMTLDHVRAVEAAKLAETAAREDAAKAREEIRAVRLDLQKSESRRRIMQYMSAVLLVALVILVFILVM